MGPQSRNSFYCTFWQIRVRYMQRHTLLWRTGRKSDMKEYIKGAGGTVVSKSILEGTSRLRWFFRQEAGHGNGWIAFGDKDTQEYVDNPDNMAVVDFNVLANIEPAVVNVFYLPAGTDLEFRSDGTGAYFINTQTGEEIRERAKNPLQEAFEIGRAHV